MSIAVKTIKNPDILWIYPTTQSIVPQEIPLKYSQYSIVRPRNWNLHWSNAGILLLWDLRGVLERVSAVNWTQLAHIWCWKCGNSVNICYVTEMDQQSSEHPILSRSTEHFWCWGESEIQRQALQTVGSWMMRQVGSTVQPRSHCKWCNY